MVYNYFKLYYPYSNSLLIQTPLIYIAYTVLEDYKYKPITCGRYDKSESNVDSENKGSRGKSSQRDGSRGIF